MQFLPHMATLFYTCPYNIISFSYPLNPQAASVILYNNKRPIDEIDKQDITIQAA